MAADLSHLTSLFENATEGIILTGGAGNIVLVNPAAEKMFGYHSDELIGNPIEILIPDRYKPNHHELRAGFYKKPSNRVMGHGRDLYARKKDGTNVPVEVSLSHYKKDDELFVIAFIVDISHRKEIEQNMLSQQKELERISHEVRRLNADLEVKVEERTMILKEALQRLEQSQKELSEALDKEKLLNEIKSRFVSMASHEFRTPLSTVLSSASLLGKYTREEEQDKRSRHIDKIKDSVKHLNDILEDFLSLGKLDEGRVESHSNEFNLHELLSETVDEMKGLLKKNQNIRVNYTGHEIIGSDKKLLKNVIINLITNAIKFSAEGEEMNISAKAGPDITVIEVEDHGIGIGKEDQDHLFTSFFRGANALNIQGTGLGLHIVKRYLDLLGGSVRLKSALGEGTSVTIT
ncbi:MAG TPA: PAS domain-containing sensor histidine kinase, partial [Chitinophagaceae bacterium]|nr:PAS domain-containing sensor histidine kinase [Chitinophagaceae bacterium]